mmetsp:Transcript_41027/g.108631  ORF Transcript_41027/g.108631 Transcript_41027/m.108631 type:complete len:99 (+) Transcript_41027:3-299(+)
MDIVDSHQLHAGRINQWSTIPTHQDTTFTSVKHVFEAAEETFDRAAASASGGQQAHYDTDTSIEYVTEALPLSPSCVRDCASTSLMDGSRSASCQTRC